MSRLCTVQLTIGYKFEDIGMIKKAVVKTLWLILGRRNLARFARFITNEVRMDTINDMSSNGELTVQSVALDIARSKDQESVVFDAGANIGEWTASLQDMSGGDVRNLSIHSFEPCKATFETLEKNVKKHPASDRVRTVKLALSDAPGTAELNVVNDGAGTNSLHHHIDLKVTKTEEIKLTTVDEYCQENGIDAIDLVKIDTEGHDPSVLRGAETMLQVGNIEMIQFEYTHRWITSGNFLRDIFHLLQPYGYRIGKITPKGIEFYEDWHFELESFREANYLACKPEHMSRFNQIKWWNA